MGKRNILFNFTRAVPARCGALLLSCFFMCAAESRGKSAPGAALSLSKLSKRYGFRSMSENGKLLTLSTKYNKITFETETRKAKFNQVLIWLNAPVAKHRGSWTIREADLYKTLLPMLTPSTALKDKGWRLVVLDPGHGGKDRGASDLRCNLEEKNVVLDIAKRVRTILSSSKITVRLTRSDDTYLALSRRCDLANKWKADLFVSIHLNAAANSGSSGLETHILPPAGCPITASAVVGSSDRRTFPGNKHDEANMLLGYYLQKSLLNRLRMQDRGVRRSRFFVLRNTDCPAALVECGFISNSTERNRILTEAYRAETARSIAEGIIAYLNAVKRARGIKR